MSQAITHRRRYLRLRKDERHKLHQGASPHPPLPRGPAMRTPPAFGQATVPFCPERLVARVKGSAKCA